MAKPLKRRGNGLGSIWQRSNGFWSWQITLGYTTDDKRVAKSGSAKTKTQATKDAAAALTAHQQGILAAPDRITVSEWLDKWLEGKKSGISENTALRYAQLIKHNIAPHLGSKKLQALKPVDLRNWHTLLFESGLSPKSIRSAHSLLYSAMKRAVSLELIMRNLADVVRPELPKQDNSIKPSQVWTAQEATRFIAIARGSRDYPMLYLILALGLRRGEVCGLRWQHIDFEKSSVAIEDNLILVGSKLTVSSTKTKHSHRTLLLPPEALEVVRLHKASQIQRHTEFGVRPTRDWLFTTDTGTVFRPDNLMRTYKALCLQAGVRAVRLHDLRHTYISLAGRAGVPLGVVSKQAGHARASFTADVYRHIYKDEMQQAAINLSELLADTPRVHN